MLGGTESANFFHNQPHFIPYFVLAVLYFLLYDATINKKKSYYGLYMGMGLAYVALVLIECAEYIGYKRSQVHLPKD